jgi:uncharacterized protein (TIGR03437 family)
MAALNRLALLIQFAFASAAGSMAASHSGPWNFQVSWQTNPCEKAGLGTAVLHVVEAPRKGVFAACRQGDQPAAPAVVVYLDERQNVVWSFGFGGQRGSDVLALSAGPDGGVYAAGATYSADFPVVNGFMKTFTSGRERMGFVAHLDAGGRLVASTLLGGAGDTSVTALAVDSKGTVLAAGTTSARDFPTSGDAFIPRILPGSSFVPPRYGFLFRFHASLDRMLYSTLIGSSDPRCSGGSNCLSAVASTTISAIALDRPENVIITGATTTRSFPVIAGQSFAGGGSSDAILAKFSADRTSLMWSIQFGGGAPFLLSGGDGANALAVEDTGRITVGGYTNSDSFPVTEDAYRKPDPLTGTMARRGFLTRFDPDSTMLYSTVTDSEVGSLSPDPDSAIWFSGGSRLSRLTPGKLSLDYSQQLGGAGDRFVRTAGFLLWNPTSVITSLSPSAEQTPQMLTVSPQPIPVGDVLKIAGISLGPPQEKSAAIENGMLAEDIDGIRVFFNGIASRLIRAGPDGFELIVPSAVAGFGETLIDVAHGYTIVASRVVKIAHPKVRTLGVLNATGIPLTTVPGHAGDIVSAFVWDPGVIDKTCSEGAVWMQATELQDVVGASLDVIPATVTYAGTVPGNLCGLKQVNIEVPQVSHYTTELLLTVGTTTLHMPVLVDWLP